MEFLGGTPEGIRRAAELLRGGEVVGIPTDTVYGLAALASRPEAIERVYEIKGRPADRPLVLFVADLAAAEAWVEVDARARACMERWWPGAVTLVLPTRPGAGPRPTMALRIPDHALVGALLAEVGEALATTSANLSGQPPALV